MPVPNTKRDWFWVIAFAALYFGSAKFGLSLALVHSNITAIWPPTGISLASLLIFGIRLWPGVFIGAFFANLTTDGTELTSLLIAIGNTLEAIIGVYLINRFANGRRAFEHLQNTLKFIFFGGLLAPAISTVVGVMSLFLAGFLEYREISAALLTWWLGDASSAIVIAPLILLWANDYLISFSREQIAEIVLIFVTLIILARTVFGGLFFAYDNYPLEFLIIPILAWVSIRFTPRGTMTCVAIISVIFLWGTLNGYGPFVGSWIPNKSFIFLQAFVMTIAASSLALAATVWERRQTEKALQVADQAKDEFLTTLSHELRNPLASVFTDLQLVQFGSAKYARKKMALKNIEFDLRHVASLLDDLLDLSRVRRSKLQLVKELIEVNSLVKEVADAMRPIVEENNQNLIVERYESPLWIEADPKRAKQILVNLLGNAAKYTHEGGNIWISVLKRSKTSVSIQVCDTGQGMTPDIISKIFDMFNQEGKPASKTSRGFRGLGIGLTVVKKFVELHGGEVKAESEGLGKGSKFTVTFPLSLQPPKQIEKHEFSETLEKQPTNQFSSRKMKKLNIMIVDDNERAANSLSELMRHFTYNPIVVYNGISALRMAQKELPDAVILDIGLPDVSGYEVGRELRKRYDKLGRKLLLIALSGYGQLDDIKKSKEAGFDHHLVKPVDINTLDEILKGAL